MGACQEPHCNTPALPDGFWCADHAAADLHLVEQGLVIGYLDGVAKTVQTALADGNPVPDAVIEHLHAAPCHYQGYEATSGGITYRWEPDLGVYSPAAASSQEPVSQQLRFGPGGIPHATPRCLEFDCSARPVHGNRCPRHTTDELFVVSTPDVIHFLEGVTDTVLGQAAFLRPLLPDAVIDQLHALPPTFQGQQYTTNDQTYHWGPVLGAYYPSRDPDGQKEPPHDRP